MDFHVNGGIAAKTEVQAGIVAGIKTTLAQNALGLPFPAITNENPRSNCASIGLNALEFHLDPIGIPADVIAQQGGRFVQVYDENVNVTIVVEVAKRTSPAAMRRGNAGASSFDEFFKGLISEITKNGAGRLVRILAELSFDFRVNVTGNHEKIGMTIVIQIDYSGAPANKTGLNSNTSAAGDIIKIALTVIVIKNAGVVGKVGLEEIEMSVEIIIANPDAHAGLFFAIITERYAAQNALFPERTVVVIHEKKSER